MLWNSLLKQAQANWEQSRANALAQARANEVAVLANDSEASRANLAQARANEESSRAIHLLAQRMPSMGAIEVVPDRLEAWYAAECDAEDGVTIAGAIAKQAEGLHDPGKCDGQGGGEISSTFTKTTMGTKRYRLFSSCFLQAGKAKTGGNLLLQERLLL